MFGGLVHISVANRRPETNIFFRLAYLSTPNTSLPFAPAEPAAHSFWISTGVVGAAAGASGPGSPAAEAGVPGG